jgi:hypothetical protein
MSTPEQNMSIASAAEGEDDFEHYFNATHRLSAEVEQLRAQVAEQGTRYEALWRFKERQSECLERAERVIASAQRVDACPYAFQGSEMHIEPNGCLTRLHDALADAGRTIGDGVIDGSVP